jgi:hypothetical protein
LKFFRTKRVEAHLSFLHGSDGGSLSQAPACAVGGWKPPLHPRMEETQMRPAWGIP